MFLLYNDGLNKKMFFLEKSFGFVGGGGESLQFGVGSLQRYCLN
jgi:hypothetical protein